MQRQGQLLLECFELFEAGMIRCIGKQDASKSKQGARSKAQDTDL